MPHHLLYPLSPVLALLAATGSGLAIRRAWGLRPVVWLGWCAPVPLLLLLPWLDPWTLTLAGLLTGLIGYGGHLRFFRLVLPARAVATTWLVLAAGLALLCWITRGLAAALPPPLAVFAWPLALVSLEAVIARVSPHGDALTLATSQAAATPLLQIAALSGLHGVVFTLGLGSAWLVEVLRVLCLGATPTGLLLSSATLAALAGYGIARLRRASPQQAPAVTLLASDADDARMLDSYTSAITGMPAHGLVVLPEKRFAATGEVDRILLALAADRHSVIVAGLEASDGHRTRNIARVYTADGQVRDYAKRFLVPGLEDGVHPGSTPLITGNGIALAVCRDVFFAASTRSYAPPTARMLVVPAWDFDVDAWVRARLAVLRGIECGLPVLRSARNGLLTISDPYGRIVAETASTAAITSVSAPLPAALPAPTLYTRGGRHFDLLCLTLTVGLLASLL
ncbi:hypothetical protein [Jeongeupia chitinilytica]|uniref:CN hydrolase domain-containing protein n=1 Tax=Jeongeupia chitinilytica TaxID=1041641 RepID=A0ABQ3H311_9NEIS|nr:hypothetical protein [Jeongeupia chitinilytica]GHD67647.1 hypothetical protein GCM10007350_31630 [Jeongeupia chitinilytica]